MNRQDTLLISITMWDYLLSGHLNNYILYWDIPLHLGRPSMSGMSSSARRRWSRFHTASNRSLIFNAIMARHNSYEVHTDEHYVHSILD